MNPRYMAQMTDMSSKMPEKSLEEVRKEASMAKAMIKAQEEAIVKACGEEIKAVLAKHNCVMMAIPTVVPAGNGGYVLSANVAIQNKPEEG